MKTSSAILVAIVAAALGAYGYSLLAPAKVAPTEHAADKKPEKPNDHVEQDEHGADRIRISDVKLAAAGVTLAAAASATLTDTLSFNGILRANQEAVVQVTPRFPGLAKSIQKRIGDNVGKDEPLATIESNQSLTVYELKAPIAGPSSNGRSRSANTPPSRSRLSSSPISRPSGSTCRSTGRTSNAFASTTRC